MNTPQPSLLIAGISGALVGLMTFATRWVLSSARAALTPDLPDHRTALAVYDVAIEGVVLFGLIGAILVTLVTWLAFVMSERLAQLPAAASAPEPDPTPAAPSPDEA